MQKNEMKHWSSLWSSLPLFPEICCRNGPDRGPHHGIYVKNAAEMVLTVVLTTAFTQNKLQALSHARGPRSGIYSKEAVELGLKSQLTPRLRLSVFCGVRLLINPLMIIIDILTIRNGLRNPQTVILDILPTPTESPLKKLLQL